jgi:hypothetical protein
VPPLLRDQPSHMFLDMIDLWARCLLTSRVPPWLETLAIFWWLIAAVSMSCFLDALGTSF